MASRKREFVPIAEAAERLANGLVGLVAAYKAETHPTLRHVYFKALNAALRDLENFVVPAASKAAQSRAAELGVSDLSKLDWNRQKEKLGDRKGIKWEHSQPVRQMITALEDVPTTPDAIAEVLKTAAIAWITHEENEALKVRGWHHKRADWRQCYADAGIELA
jgi:hypothetical protein